MFDGKVVPIGFCHSKEFGFGLKFGGGIGRCELVPRAGGLATVAPVDGGAHTLLGLFGEFATVFDELIGQALLAIETPFVGNGTGGTGFYAATAIAATAWHRTVVAVELVGKEDFAKEKHRASTGNDGLMVLSYPP